MLPSGGILLSVSAEGYAKLSTGEIVKVPPGSRVEQQFDPNNGVIVILPFNGGIVSLP